MKDLKKLLHVFVLNVSVIKIKYIILEENTNKSKYAYVFLRLYSHTDSFDFQNKIIPPDDGRFLAQASGQV